MVIDFSKADNDKSIQQRLSRLDEWFTIFSTEEAIFTNEFLFCSQNFAAWWR